MKVQKIFICLFALAIVATQSCTKTTPVTAPTAHLMYVNGYLPVTTIINGSANGSIVGGAYDIGYDSTSIGGYVSVTTGTNVDLSFGVSGINQTLTGLVASISSDNYYSIFIGGELTVPYTVFTQDTIPTPSYNVSNIRCVNLCPYADSTKITVSTSATNTIVSGLGTQKISSFVPIASGSYTFETSATTTYGNASPLGHTLQSGKSYTLIYSGTRFGSGSSLPALSIIQNN